MILTILLQDAIYRRNLEKTYAPGMPNHRRSGCAPSLYVQSTVRSIHSFSLMPGEITPVTQVYLPQRLSTHFSNLCVWKCQKDRRQLLQQPESFLRLPPSAGTPLILNHQLLNLVASLQLLHQPLLLPHDRRGRLLWSTLPSNSPSFLAPHSQN